MSKTLLTAIFTCNLEFITVDVIYHCTLPFVHKFYPVSHVPYLGSDASFKEDRLIFYVNYDGHIQNEALHEHLGFSLISAQKKQQYQNEHDHERR